MTRINRMDTDAQSNEHGGADREPLSAEPAPVSSEQVSMPLGDDVGANPQFSEAEPNPAFTEATAPPPRQAQLDSKIRELEQRLDEATRQIERGTNALERARQTRRLARG
jgi:hypothetical protein